MIAVESAPGDTSSPSWTAVDPCHLEWVEQPFSWASGVGVDGEANAMMPPSTTKSDPPAHDNHRKPLTSQLSVGSLAEEVRTIEQTAREMVFAVVDRDRFDDVADLARPVAISVSG